MGVIFRSTAADILKSKKGFYIFLFSIFFLMIAFQMKLFIQVGPESNPENLSHYTNLILLHFFLFIFYTVILTHASRDLEEDIKDNFHEIVLLYISRKKYLMAKLLAYSASYMLILILSGGIAITLNHFLFESSPAAASILGLACIGTNVFFLFCLLLLFIVIIRAKGVEFLVFLCYGLFSFLSYEPVLSRFIGEGKAAKIISLLAPSVLHVQNEFVRITLGWGFSEGIQLYFINFFGYLALIILLFFLKVRTYEFEK